MKKRSGFYPVVGVDAAGSGVVSLAGGAVLAETVRAVGLDRALAAALAPWRKPTAVHDPAKVLCDLAVALALGGDCLADVALLRAEPGVYGRVASDPTVSRTVDALAADAPRVLAAIGAARAQARVRAWRLAGRHAPDFEVDAGRPLVIDADATLVTAHSEKEQAAPTFRRGYGFHPLWTFLDHGPDGTGEPLAFLLRPGTPGRTPPPTTSPWSAPRRGSYPRIDQEPARAGGCWSAPTPRRHPRVPGLAGRTAAVLLGRVQPADRLRARPEEDPEAGVDPGPRR